MDKLHNDLKRRVYLRSKFEDGDRPNGQAFTDLIDSSLNQKSDKIFAVDHKIGIGTDNPTAPLEVSGGRKEVNQSFLATDVTNSTFRIAHPKEGIVSFGCNQSEELHIGVFKKNGSSYDSHMVIESNGNVGIGVENSDEKLAIGGSLKVEQNLFLGDCKLTFEKGKLFLKSCDTNYQILMMDAADKPIVPIRNKLLVIVVILLCVLIIILLLVIYYAYINSTT